jgi:hypothetical protein
MNKFEQCECKGQRAAAARRRTRGGCKANARRRQGERVAAAALRQGEDGAIAVYLSARSTSKSSAANA